MFRDTAFSVLHKPTVLINLIAIALSVISSSVKPRASEPKNVPATQLTNTKPIMIIAATWKPTVSMRIGTRNPQIAAEKRVTKNVNP